MNKVIKASGNSVEAYWPTLFAKALNTTNIGELLQNVISAGPAVGPVAAAGGAEAEAEPEKEEKKEEVEDVDMGGLFGGDDDEY